MVIPAGKTHLTCDIWWNKPQFLGGFRRCVVFLGFHLVRDKQHRAGVRNLVFRFTGPKHSSTSGRSNHRKYVFSIPRMKGLVDFDMTEEVVTSAIPTKKRLVCCFLLSPSSVVLKPDNDVCFQRQKNLLNKVWVNKRKR